LWRSHDNLEVGVGQGFDDTFGDLLGFLRLDASLRWLAAALADRSCDDGIYLVLVNQWSHQSKRFIVVRSERRQRCRAGLAGQRWQFSI